MAETNVELPEKLHQLVEVAIKDAKACEVDSNYELNMSAWHFRNPGQVCYVCMAGAVMAKTLKVGLNVTGNTRPDDWEPEIENALYAIDALLEGDLEEALYQAGVKKAEYPKDLNTFPRPFSGPPPGENFGEFIKSWEKTQQWLEERNL